MSTVTNETVESIWTRFGSRLSTWGSKVVKTTKFVSKKVGNWFLAVAKKSGGFIKKAAKWVFEAKATQWVVVKTKPVWSKAWQLLKGPIGWVAATIGAVALAPKLVIALLIALGVLVIVLAVLLFFAYRSVRKQYTAEEWAEYKNGDFESYVAHTESTPEGTVRTITITSKDGGIKTTTITTKLDGTQETVTSETHPTDKATVKTETTTTEKPAKAVEAQSPFAEKVKAEELKAAGSKGKNARMRLDGILLREETTSARISFLDEKGKEASDNADVDLASEAQARMHLIIVRISDDGTLPTEEASADAIYRDCRKTAENLYPDFPWNWDLMSRSVKNEYKRFDDRDKLHEEASEAS